MDVPASCLRLFINSDLKGAHPFRSFSRLSRNLLRRPDDLTGQKLSWPPFRGKRRRIDTEQELDIIYRSGFSGGTLSETIFSKFPGARERFVEQTHGLVRDVFGCPAHTGTGLSVMVNEAVRRIDKARTASGRSDADTAMQAWEGLVRGRWSLVDRFDTDGKRFIVAIKNDPAHPDPRRRHPSPAGLTNSQRHTVPTPGVAAI